MVNFSSLFAEAEILPIFKNSRELYRTRSNNKQIADLASIKEVDIQGDQDDAWVLIDVD